MWVQQCWPGVARSRSWYRTSTQHCNNLVPEAVRSINQAGRGGSGGSRRGGPGRAGLTMPRLRKSWPACLKLSALTALLFFSLSLLREVPSQSQPGKPENTSKQSAHLPNKTVKQANSKNKAKPSQQEARQIKGVVEVKPVEGDGEKGEVLLMGQVDKRRVGGVGEEEKVGAGGVGGGGDSLAGERLEGLPNISQPRKEEHSSALPPASQILDKILRANNKQVKRMHFILPSVNSC